MGDLIHMDYGKIAYLKVDELESAINNFASQKSKNIKSSSFKSYPNVPFLFDSAIFDVCKVSGLGEGSIIFTLEFLVHSVGECDIVYGDFVIEKIRFDSVGLINKTIICSINFGQSTDLKIRASDFRGYLKTISFVLIGSDAKIDKLNSSFCVAESSDMQAILHIVNNSIYLDFYLNSDLKEKYGTVFIGHGNYVDIAYVSNNTFFVCYQDNYKNLFGVLVDTLGQYNILKIDDAVDSFAICSYNEFLIKATLKDNILLLQVLDKDFVVIDSSSLENLKMKIDKIIFSKGNLNSPKNLFAVSGDKIYLLKLDIDIMFNLTQEIKTLLKVGG